MIILIVDIRFFFGVRTLIKLMLLAQAAAQSTVPDTFTWSFTGTAVIVGLSLLFLLIIPRTIRFPHTGPKMPLPFPSVFNNPSVGSFIASMSAGHLFGIPIVLGLNNLGVLR